MIWIASYKYITNPDGNVKPATVMSMKYISPSTDYTKQQTEWVWRSIHQTILLKNQVFTIWIMTTMHHVSAPVTLVTALGTAPSRLGGRWRVEITSYCHRHPLLETISTNMFHSKFKSSEEITVCLCSFPGNEIATNFCTCHDSCAVVTCAKFCGDHFVIIRLRVKGNCIWIWITSEMKWTPSRSQGQHSSYQYCPPLKILT